MFAGLPAALEQGGEGVVEPKDSPAAVLRIEKPDLAGGAVNLLPAKRNDFALAPSARIGEVS